MIHYLYERYILLTHHKSLKCIILWCTCTLYFRIISCWDIKSIGGYIYFKFNNRSFELWLTYLYLLYTIQIVWKISKLTTVVPYTFNTSHIYYYDNIPISPFGKQQKYWAEVKKIKKNENNTNTADALLNKRHTNRIHA